MKNVRTQFLECEIRGQLWYIDLKQADSYANIVLKNTQCSITLVDKSSVSNTEVIS